LDGLAARLVYNPNFAEGLSTSLRAGLAAVPPDSDAAVVSLGDMPQVDAALINGLIDAFDPARGALIALPTFDGKRGNPVLWSRRFFPELMAIEGDVGARHVIGAYGEAIVEVPVSDRAPLIDIDTPDELSALALSMGGR
jgi:molybdenum cofactor cytidylyltransferase